MGRLTSTSPSSLAAVFATLCATLFAALACSVLAAPAAVAQTNDALVARVERAKAELAAIRSRAGRVSDVDQIENLQRSYGYYVDKMLWEEVVDLFADNGTIERGASGVYVGKDSIRRYLYGLSGGKQGPLEGVMFNHMQLQPIVTVADDGLSAKARWRAFVQGGVSGEGSGGYWGEGPYENEYVKEDGTWKISKLRWYPTFIAPYEGGWLEVEQADLRRDTIGRGAEPDRPQSDDYRPYPAAYVPPFHYPNPVTGD